MATTKKDSSDKKSSSTKSSSTKSQKRLSPQEEAQRLEARRLQAQREATLPADAPARQFNPLSRSITSLNSEPLEVDEEGEPVEIPSGAPSAGGTTTGTDATAGTTTTVDRD